MRSRNAAYARVAGFMYLFTIGSYLLGTRLVSSPPVSTQRIGLLLMLTTSWATVPLATSLYAILRDVNPLLALFALAWRVGESVLGSLIIVMRFVLLGAAEQDSANASAASIIRSFNATLLSVTTLFFTAGSTLFFYLFLKSRRMPRAISAFGLIASVLFGLLACANLLNITLPKLLAYAWGPMLPAEIIAGLWLLVFGVGRPQPATTPAPAQIKEV